MARLNTGTGSNSLTIANRKTGTIQKIVLIVRPEKKATPRRLRKNALTLLFACCKELYFSLNRDTVSTCPNP